MAQKSYESNSGAVWAGIRDLRDTKNKPCDNLLDTDRLDGKTVLLTGASSGLGFAVARNLAGRGAHVLMVCRRDAEKELELVKKAGAGSGGSAEVLKADMTDFSSIRRMVSELRKKNIQVDVAISNAASVCSYARKTTDGFEEMLQVNALAPALLLVELLKAGVIPNNTFAQNGRTMTEKNGTGFIPRIVVVASEAHRSANDFMMDTLGLVEPYTMSESTVRYGWTKLHLLTFTRELTRRLTRNGRLDVSVHALCPGPIASNIAREAPAIARPFANLFFRLFFQSPENAAKPVVYLASSPRIEGQTGRYQFLMQERDPSKTADSIENGKIVWKGYETLFINK